MMLLSFLFFPSFAACPRGAPFIMCHNNPCERASCPANPKAKCLPDNCGGCNAQFFDDNDNIVDCLASTYRGIDYFFVLGYLLEIFVICQSSNLSVSLSVQTSLDMILNTFFVNCETN